MALTYIDSFKGYVTDVPELWFRRKSDGRVFHYDQLSSGNVSPQVNFNEVNGGWSLYPVAYLPGQSTMEMSFESVQFDADLFAMANQQDFKSDATYTVYKTLKLTAGGSTGAVTLTLPGTTPDTPKANTISVQGIKEHSGVNDETTPYVSISSGVITVTGDSGIAVGDEVEVSYEVVTTANSVEITNDRSAVGELACKWPVYATGDEETNLGGGIKGYVYMKIYKCRVTAMPGFDTSLNDGFLAQQCA